MERYVVLGLGRARADWFRLVGQWATSAAIPAEFAKCVSAEELRARLVSGRPYSAALLDAALASVDRDLLADVRAAGAVPVVVGDGRQDGDWVALGAVAVLPPTFGRDDLLEVLGLHARLVANAALPVGDDSPAPAAPASGRLAAVLGPGGTGASTAAIALAQGLAGEHNVCLADLCRHAEQAMLHDSRDVVPGLQEVVELARARTPDALSVRALTFHVPARGYRLLLGLRRARYWSSLRLRAVEAAVDGLRRAFDVVVADTDPDLEGEDDTGVVEVEERHQLTRLAVARADAVFTVGAPGMKGIYSLVRLVGDLADLGVPTTRIVPVVNRAPRSPKARAELARTFAELGSVPEAERLATPVFLPRRKVEQALRDGAPLPAPLPQLLAGAWRAVTGRAGRPAEALPAVPQPVRPGSLGSAWHGAGSRPGPPSPSAGGDHGG